MADADADGLVGEDLEGDDGVGEGLRPCEDVGASELGIVSRSAADELVLTPVATVSSLTRSAA